MINSWSIPLKNSNKTPFINKGLPNWINLIIVFTLILIKIGIPDFIIDAIINTIFYTIIATPKNKTFLNKDKKSKDNNNWTVNCITVNSPIEENFFSILNSCK